MGGVGCKGARTEKLALSVIRDPAGQHKAPVAISALDKANLWINFQPDARVAERRVGEAVAGAITGDTRFGDVDGFGRLLGHANAIASRRASRQPLSHARTRR